VKDYCKIKAEKRREKMKSVITAESTDFWAQLEGGCLVKKRGVAADDRGATELLKRKKRSTGL